MSAVVMAWIFSFLFSPDSIDELTVLFGVLTAVFIAMVYHMTAHTLQQQATTWVTEHPAGVEDGAMFTTDHYTLSVSELSLQQHQPASTSSLRTMTSGHAGVLMSLQPYSNRTPLNEEQYAALAWPQPAYQPNEPHKPAPGGWAYKGWLNTKPSEVHKKEKKNHVQDVETQLRQKPKAYKDHKDCPRVKYAYSTLDYNELNCPIVSVIKSSQMHIVGPTRTYSARSHGPTLRLTWKDTRIVDKGWING
ncbi:hypothetical protein B0H13DRAFT_1923114 [Mycena leptocephala]|nr:hypothetical protein B0H13DRAFT_1923114 [Mycena leptocephala]